MKIHEEVVAARITIDPFDPSCITTNSYDLKLGDSLIRYTSEILDPKVRPEFETICIPREGYLMQTGEFLLGHSSEIIGSDHYVPLIHAKSGIARMGLFVHVTADLIDIGSHGHSTFQLHATLPVRIFAGMKIGQVTFWVPKGEIKLYEGKYQHSKGPQISKTYLDYEMSDDEKRS